MGFSSEWEDQYRSNEQLSIWPWSDLISLVINHTDIRNNESCKVLELGCGAGANIPFFKSLKVDYYAIEGSPTIVERLKENFGGFAENIVVGDFTKEIPFEDSFDLIVDRGSITCNTLEGIENCLNLVHQKLAPKGKFIGITWLSDKHSEASRGTPGNDDFTRINYLGNLHFSTREHLEDLLQNFKIEVLQEQSLNYLVGSDLISANWNFVVSKR